MPRTKTGSKYLQATKHLIARHIRGRKPKRLHINSEQTGFVQSDKPLRADMKPEGMWYGFNDSWMQWVISEVDGSWLQPYVYEIVPDESKILRISDVEAFEAFEDEYWARIPSSRQIEDDPLDDLLAPGYPMYGRRFVTYINWKKVGERYCGLEITPYLWEKRLDSLWYYGWDCESGVIWHKDGIKEIKLFAEYDEGLGEFRRAR